MNTENLTALTDVIADQRAVIKKAARDLYAIVVRQSMVGWEDDTAERLIKIQHALAAAYNGDHSDGSAS